MDRSTEALISQLVDDLSPVNRLASPLRRSGLWLLVFGLMAIALVSATADLDLFIRRAREAVLMHELAGTLVTGIIAVIAAFHLVLPDRSPRWGLAPAPPLLLWFWAAGSSCWHQWIVAGSDDWSIGECLKCFVWIVGFGVTLGVSLWIVLRRARPIELMLPVSIAALGSSALAAFLLQFFHPFDVTFLDLGLHLVAIGVVVATVASLARRSSYAD